MANRTTRLNNKSDKPKGILYIPTNEQEPLIQNACKKLARPRTFIVGLALESVLGALDAGKAVVEGTRVVFTEGAK
ncbi:MAG: hypothetical protein NTU84_00580 [Verrucomicrobia bacterium]|nr:hypothetical protein [Verrucomicrobiota bacterium]